MFNNNNIAFQSQASWGRLKLKPTKSPKSRFRHFNSNAPEIRLGNLMFPSSCVPFSCVLPYQILLMLLSTLMCGKLISHHKLISQSEIFLLQMETTFVFFQQQCYQHFHYTHNDMLSSGYICLTFFELCKSVYMFSHYISEALPFFPHLFEDIR